MSLQKRIENATSVDHLLDWVQPDRTEFHDRPCEVSKVPPEIVSEIFCHCLPPRNLIKPLPGETPLLLGQISRRWRTIALSTPTLWTAICLIDPHSEGICSLLEVWLSRARGGPLSINLQWVEHDSWDTMSAVCGVIGPFASQLETLWLSMVYPKFVRLPFLRGQLPSLKQLNLNVTPFAGSGDLQDMTVFAEAPLLDTVILQQDLIIPLPWTQLKHLSLLNMDWDVCLRRMQRAVNLTNCNLVPPMEPAPTRPPSTHLISLVSLHLLSELENGVALSALTLPALRDLTVKIRADDIQDFLQFLTRNSTRLRLLRLTTDLDEGFVHECLHHESVASVEELEFTFDNAFPTSSVFRLLHNPEFLPYLRCLSIREWGMHSPPTPNYAALLLDVLYVGAASRPHFKTFSLETKHELPIPDAVKLQGLLDQGMSITIEAIEGIDDEARRGMWTLAELEDLQFEDQM
ncbi:hypothetical protein DFH07DRAFT_965722 [Mycena maculata]|uniref:F-box domain-containing protein n=1 Tax=Mycena maculata TaxID=230809 RepID=A0AAD7IBL6_9AGAR|nr:hypothetical protein DFH07DRAFT_965722 [Mycena maculata]